MADDSLLNIRISGDATGGVAASEEMSAAVAALEARIAELEKQLSTTTVAITGMDRAMAGGAARIAAYEAGLGPLGFALSRVGASSETLAPILAAAFPVFAAIALIGVLG